MRKVNISLDAAEISPAVLTPQQVREAIRVNGVSQEEIASRIKVPVQVIRDLLRSDPKRRLKGYRGDPHKAAVALALKPAPSGMAPLPFISEALRNLRPPLSPTRRRHRRPATATENL